MANRTLQLQQDRDARLADAKAILAVATTENRAMNPEELTRFDGFTTLAEGITASLNAEQRAAALSNIPNDNPAGSAEVRDNWRDKECLFGDEPVSGESKEARKDRVGRGFGAQMLAVRNAAMSGGNPAAVDKRLLELNNRYQKRLGTGPAGASEQVPADGGFLVYPEYSQEIVMIAHDVGQVYTKTRQLPIAETTNTVNIPGIDEQSRKNGSRWGGILAYWQNEADALNATKPKFRLITLVLKKLTGLMYTTDELLVDAPSFGALAMQGFGEEFAFRMDDGMINGTGAGMPLGILNSPALITIAKESGQATATIVFNNVTKMYYRLHARSRLNSCWFVNQDTEQQLLTMSLAVGTGGSSVVQGIGPAGVGAYVPGSNFQDGFARLLNRPVVPIEQAQTLGTLGDIILADMSQVVRIQKDMQSAASMHVKFLTDEMTYRFIWRADAQPIWHTALTPFNGTNTLSPFVALAARP